MAEPVLNFTSVIDPVDPKKLILTDTSEYNDLVVVSRDWLIQNAEGLTTTINIPEGEENKVELLLDKDRTFVITLLINGNVAAPGSGVRHVVNVVAPGRLADTILDTRKRLLSIIEVQKCDPKDLASDIKLLDVYLSSAEDLAYIDITASQQALDHGNRYADHLKNTYR